MDKASLKLEKWPMLMGPDWSMSKDQVANEVMRLSAKNKYDLALYPDCSREGVLLVLAAIKMGRKIVLCPLREPQANIDKWLENIKCQQLKPAHEFLSIIRTSGTLAQPKSALIYLNAHVASAYAVAKAFDFDASSVWGLNLPLYHVSGLSILFRAWVMGAGIFCAQNNDELIFSIKNQMITHLSLVPTQLVRLLEMDLDMSRLKAVIIGGDALPKHLELKARSLGIKIYSTYGMTETASMIAFNEAKSHTILPHLKIKIASDQELLVKGASLFSGYLDKEHLSLPLDDEGYYATGDLFRINKLGQLHLIGRKSNRIILHGENIQAEEIEAALNEHSAIERSVVAAIKDQQYGTSMIAIIKPYQEMPDPHMLRKFLLERLSAIKVPKVFLLWPKNAPDNIKLPRQWFNQWLVNR